MEARDACLEGLKSFRSSYGVAWEGEWTREAQLDYLRAGKGKWLGWLVEEGLLPLWAMYDASLTGANLTEANLTGAMHNDRTRWPEGFDMARLEVANA